jgi:hypothetical protein
MILQCYSRSCNCRIWPRWFRILIAARVFHWRLIRVNQCLFFILVLVRKIGCASRQHESTNKEAAFFICRARLCLFMVSFRFGTFNLFEIHVINLIGVFVLVWHDVRWRMSQVAIGLRPQMIYQLHVLLVIFEPFIKRDACWGRRVSLILILIQGWFESLWMIVTRVGNLIWL